jgi:hypothetical protein
MVQSTEDFLIGLIPEAQQLGTPCANGNGPSSEALMSPDQYTGRSIHKFPAY